MKTSVKNLALILSVLLLLLCSCQTGTLSKQFESHPGEKQDFTEPKEGIAANSTKDTIGNNAPGESIDLTVKIETFDPLSFEKTIETGSAADFAEIYSDISDLECASDNVVYGEVESVAYWDLSGSANTVYSFRILETIKGDLPENAVISVITPGGYCRLQSVINVFGGGKFQNYTQEEINQTIIHRFFAGVIEEPKTGEKYILYLTSPTKDENPFPDGLYCEKGAFMGRLIEQNDGSFMRVTPQDEPDFYGTSKVAYSREELLS